MSNNMEEMRDIVTDMAEGMNMISENYNDLISIEEKIINLHWEYNEDIGMCLKVYHLITINSSEESRF